MGMAMGPGLMPNVPLGVPPPGMQGLMGNPLMHQQMMSRMPQPVGSPFNPPRKCSARILQQNIVFTYFWNSSLN